MTAYRDTIEGCLVDAEPAPVGIRVLCGPRHSSETITRRGDWVVLTSGRGYEVWPHRDFGEYHEKCDIRKQAKLDELIRDCENLRRRVREAVA